MRILITLYLKVTFNFSCYASNYVAVSNIVCGTQIVGCRRSKLKALNRISRFIDESKRRILVNTFIKSQFNYVPLVWMFCSRNANGMINNIHERALRTIYDDQTSSFLELLDLRNDICMHQRNLQLLMTEIFKCLNSFSPPIMNNFVTTRDIPYNLRNARELSNERRRTVRYGLESISNRAPLLWSQVPEHLKHIDSVATFKQEIKMWTGDNCSCRLCQNYVEQLGFI